MERTWLITGCSSGLGKGIAKAVLARGDRAAMEESQPHQVAELFAVNFFGPMDLIRAALPGMRERGGG